MLLNHFKKETNNCFHHLSSKLRAEKLNFVRFYISDKKFQTMVRSWYGDIEVASDCLNLAKSMDTKRLYELTGVEYFKVHVRKRYFAVFIKKLFSLK